MKKEDFPQPSDDRQAYSVQRIIHVSINSQGLKTTVPKNFQFMKYLFKNSNGVKLRTQVLSSSNHLTEIANKIGYYSKNYAYKLMAKAIQSLLVRIHFTTVITIIKNTATTLASPFFSFHKFTLLNILTESLQQ